MNEVSEGFVRWKDLVGEKGEKIMAKGEKWSVKGLSDSNVTVNIEREKQTLRRGSHGKVNRLLGGKVQFGLEANKDAQHFF